MKKRTFKSYQIEHQEPFAHAELVVEACDSDGEKFFVKHNELSDDYAYVSHGKVIRNMLRNGYKDVSEVK